MLMHGIPFRFEGGVVSAAAWYGRPWGTHHPSGPLSFGIIRPSAPEVYWESGVSLRTIFFLSQLTRWR
jgi:hypothetical protein